MLKQKIKYKHWKTDEVLEITCRTGDFPENLQSDRIVVWDLVKEKYEDIIKSTIVEIEIIL